MRCASLSIARRMSAEVFAPGAGALFPALFPLVRSLFAGLLAGLMILLSAIFAPPPYRLSKFELFRVNEEPQRTGRSVRRKCCDWL